MPLGHPDRRRGAAQQPSRLPTSAKLSNKWYELDIGWLYIRMLEASGLAKVKHVAPTPRFDARANRVTQIPLQAIIKYRYDVLAKYAQSLQGAPMPRKSQAAPARAAGGPSATEAIEPLADIGTTMMLRCERTRLAEAAAEVDVPCRRMYSMRRELAAVWGRSSASREQLVEAAAGLVPPCRVERDSAADRVLAALALVRLMSRPGALRSDTRDSSDRSRRP